MDVMLALEIQQLQEENNRAADQADQKDREYLAYKGRCNEKPPPNLANHGNDLQKLCELWRWQLQRNLDCRQMRQAFSDKWYGGTDQRHQKPIDDLDVAIKDLLDKIERLCKPCD